MPAMMAGTAGSTTSGIYMAKFAKGVLLTGGFALLALLLLIVAMFADLTFNGGRVANVLLGRDRLIAACRPEIEKGLASHRMDAATFAMGGMQRLSRTPQGGVVGMAMTVRDFQGQTYEGAFLCQTEADRARVVFQLRRSGASTSAAL